MAEPYCDAKATPEAVGSSHERSRSFINASDLIQEARMTTCSSTQCDEVLSTHLILNNRLQEKNRHWNMRYVTGQIRPISVVRD
jgi:hypothetical protein